MFKIEIKTGGAAFRDENGDLDVDGYEVRRLLKDVVEAIAYGYEGGILIDYNGNRVGNWSYNDD